MKKLFALMLAMLMVFAMVGCDKVEQVVDNAADKVVEKLTEETPAPSATPTAEPTPTPTPEPTPFAIPTLEPIPTIKPFSSGIAGQYTLTGGEIDGTYVPMEGENAGMGILLNADGTVVLTSEGEEDATGTWTQNGNSVLLVSDTGGQDIVLTVENGTLVMEEEGMKLFFTKTGSSQLTSISTGNVTEEDIIGEYDLVGAEMNGISLSLKDAPNMRFLFGNGDGFIVLDNEVEPITWTLDGNTINYVSKMTNKSYQMAVQGDKLVLEMSGVTMTFSK